VSWDFFDIAPFFSSDGLVLLVVFDILCEGMVMPRGIVAVVN